MERTAPFWGNLETFVKGGGRLTFLLGNHDIELCYPATTRLLRKRLGQDRVEFIYDNRAFNAGPVLIEHGNRYDRWNVVDHDKLREIVSALSRGEMPLDYSGPPGSQLVAQVMNPLKGQYSFVDLLKPENGGVLPLLAVFDPSSMRAIKKLAKLARESSKFSFDANGVPLDPANISRPRYGRHRRASRCCEGIRGKTPRNRFRSRAKRTSGTALPRVSEVRYRTPADFRRQSRGPGVSDAGKDVCRARFQSRRLWPHSTLIL
jgi:hypothetical protein